MNNLTDKLSKSYNNVECTGLHNSEKYYYSGLSSRYKGFSYDYYVISFKLDGSDMLFWFDPYTGDYDTIDIIKSVTMNFNDISKEVTLEEVKENNCVVFENLTLTSSDEE